MKLATLRDGSRDGQLVVVSRDLASAHYATGIAQRLQQVLDDWGFLAPQLQDLYDALNAGRARHAFPFDPAQCLAPLPRAYQCLEAAPSAAGEAMPAVQQLAGDALGGARDPLPESAVAADLDFGVGLAVVTGNLPAGSTAEQALDAVRLLMLCNRVALRALEPAERAAGAGAQHSRPTTVFGPVAVTMDEPGAAWERGRLSLVLAVQRNGRPLARCDAAAMVPGFGELIADAARTRPLGAGSIVCSGALGDAATPRSCASLQQRRGLELRQDGQASTGFLQMGDSLRIDMAGPDGASMCGAIEQTVGAAAS